MSRILMSAQELSNIETIKINSSKICNILGLNGIPRGKIIEIFGEASSGKTSLALYLAKKAIQNSVYVMYFDVEHALSLNYIKHFNLDTDKILIIQPFNAEQVFEIVEKYSNHFGIYIIDSIASLILEKDKTIDYFFHGSTSKSISLFLKRMINFLEKRKSSLICLNQVREYGTTVNALRFYSAIRIEVKMKNLIEENDKIIGTRICVKCIKNKFSVSLNEEEIDLYFHEGIRE
ncbi:MAG: DNA recombination/repair protein RecA [Endomicrobia bacterium]|nr:DNA recombination/repair protein RecA [Endomicrobiia bacterium]